MTRFGLRISPESDGPSLLFSELPEVARQPRRLPPKRVRGIGGFNMFVET